MGAPSQEANRCSPSGVAQMADIKKSWGEERKRKMKTSPRMSRPQSSAHFFPLLFCIMPCQERGFPSFLLSCQSFLQVLLQPLRTVDHFLIVVLLPHTASAAGSCCWSSNRAETTDATHSYICQAHTSVKYKFSTSNSLYCCLPIVRVKHNITWALHITTYTHMCMHTPSHTHLFLLLRIPPKNRGFYLEHASSRVWTGIERLRPVVTVAVCVCLCVYERVDNHPHGRDIPRLTAPVTPSPPFLSLLSSRKAPILSLVALTQNWG